MLNKWKEFRKNHRKSIVKHIWETKAKKPRKTALFPRVVDAFRFANPPNLLPSNKNQNKTKPTTKCVKTK